MGHGVLGTASLIPTTGVDPNVPSGVGSSIPVHLKDLMCQAELTLNALKYLCIEAIHVYL